jgi:formyl-CoA transferase
MGGLMSVTGAPGAGPMRVGIPIADLTAGLFCALGIMTALLEREVSGEGQWVNTSLLQAQIFMLDFQASRFLTEGQVAKQAGNNHPTSIPTGVFKTKDGHLNIAVTGTVIWERFCNAVGHPEWIASPDFKNGKLRLQNRDALNAEIDKATATKSSAEWVDIFNKVGVPCGPINTIDQVFADPQVKHLGLAQESARSDGSRLGLVGQPFKLSRTPSKIAARPPDLGEHTDEILKEFGFAEKDIAELHAVKAV